MRNNKFHHRFIIGESLVMNAVIHPVITYPSLPRRGERVVVTEVVTLPPVTPTQPTRRVVTDWLRRVQTSATPEAA